MHFGSPCFFNGFASCHFSVKQPLVRFTSTSSINLFLYLFSLPSIFLEISRCLAYLFVCTNIFVSITEVSYWRFDSFGGLWGACLTLESCGRCEARSTSFTSAAQPLRPDCRLWVLVVALASPQCSKGRFKDLQDCFPHLI